MDRSAVKAALEQLQRQQIDNLTCQAPMEMQQLEQFMVGEPEMRTVRARQWPAASRALSMPGNV